MHVNDRQQATTKGFQGTQLKDMLNTRVKPTQARLLWGKVPSPGRFVPHMQSVPRLEWGTSPAFLCFISVAKSSFASRSPQHQGYLGYRDSNLWPKGQLLTLSLSADWITQSVRTAY
jgi:hypothetical protein